MKTLILHSDNLAATSRSLCAGTATAINTAAAPGLAVGLAVNAAALPAPSDAADWLQIAPYHEGAYWQQEQGQMVRYTQVFIRPQADKMVVAFNAQVMRQGTNFKGLPVYAGHPDADPVRWPDERRLGGVVALDARPDGLYGRIAWNSLGRENQRESMLVYPSPAWLFDQTVAQRTRRIVPDELRSVGMTNSPRIADVTPWTNSTPAGGVVGPRFFATAHNAHPATDSFHAPLPPILAATSPTGGGDVGADDDFDLSTPEARRRTFTARVDALTKPKQGGGGALTLDQAIAEMRSNPGDAALLKAMSGKTS